MIRRPHRPPIAATVDARPGTGAGADRTRVGDRPVPRPARTIHTGRPLARRRTARSTEALGRPGHARSHARGRHRRNGTRGDVSGAAAGAGGPRGSRREPRGARAVPRRRRLASRRARRTRPRAGRTRGPVRPGDRRSGPERRRGHDLFQPARAPNGWSTPWPARSITCSTAGRSGFTATAGPSRRPRTPPGIHTASTVAERPRSSPFCSGRPAVETSPRRCSIRATSWGRDGSP